MADFNEKLRSAKYGKDDLKYSLVIHTFESKILQFLLRAFLGCPCIRHSRQFFNYSMTAEGTKKRRVNNENIDKSVGARGKKAL